MAEISVMRTYSRGWILMTGTVAVCWRRRQPAYTVQTTLRELYAGYYYRAGLAYAELRAASETEVHRRMRFRPDTASEGY